ncbi:MAG: XylR N-terminal domain-containing protein [Bacteroidetes bacterium]|nr:XylR N-terminal domain-containing protein [Bacteroidota bacterium]
MNADQAKLIKQLKQEVATLKKENARLRANQKSDGSNQPTVKVPGSMKAIFAKAEKTVGDYFKALRFTPSQGMIDINNERYVLVRASALSHEFLNSIKDLYQNRGEDEALSIGKNILFDMAHVIGIEDAHNFHEKMKLTDPISKLSAGPVHFAYAGWAFVDISSESKPSPDDSFYLKFDHPFSFEADAWIKAGKHATTPVCIMNAGYSSGWCEASFGIPLTTVEITCRARGDASCTFIMAPPHKIDSYLKQNKKIPKLSHVEIPAFLERKKNEEKLKNSLLEKEVLLKEIHHRVKNNLQIISSLLNLQADNIKDSKTREKYIESIGRIKSMAIIHELLYRSKNLSNIKIAEYIQELVSFIKETYNVNKNIKVKLNINIRDEFIEIDKAIPCGIIINELLSNAFKYAFHDKRKGNIVVQFKELRSGSFKYHLLVSDDGVGFTDKPDIENSQTLGLQLIDSLTTQLDGQLDIRSEKGTVFSLKFS